MTVIIGVVKNNAVYMGGDAASSNGYDMTLRPNEKVFVRDGAIFGVCGSWRALDLLKYHLQVPAPHNSDLKDYIATTFLDAVRDCFKAGGYAEKENEVETITSAFFIGITGRLFEISFDYQTREIFDYAAIGSGSDVALGALYATQKQSPVKRIKTALEASAQFSAHVRGPFQIARAK